jgi:hypothetical protein
MMRQSSRTNAEQRRRRRNDSSMTLFGLTSIENSLINIFIKMGWGLKSLYFMGGIGASQLLALPVIYELKKESTKKMETRMERFLKNPRIEKTMQ